MGLTVFPLFDYQPVRVLSVRRWKLLPPHCRLGTPTVVPHTILVLVCSASFTKSEDDELSIVRACANPAGFRLRASPLRLGD